MLAWSLRKTCVAASVAVLLVCGVLFVRNESVRDADAKQVSWVSPSQTSVKLSIADSPAKQSKGLGGVPFLSPEEGMLFLFKEPFRERTFWMKEMLIAIDIVWIGGDGRVLGVEESVLPPSEIQGELPFYRSPGPVRAVLEVPAFRARSLGIEAGTPLVDLFAIFP